MLQQDKKLSAYRAKFQIARAPNVLIGIDNYTKDGGPGAVCPSCSLYHDPLRY